LLGDADNPAGRFYFLYNEASRAQKDELLEYLRGLVSNVGEVDDELTAVVVVDAGTDGIDCQLGADEDGAADRAVRRLIFHEGNLANPQAATYHGAVRGTPEWMYEYIVRFEGVY